MLQLTPAAANHLAGLLADKGVSASAAIRIVQGTSGDFQLHTDLPKSDDVGIAHRGKTLLILDQQISNLLHDRVLDLVPSSEGKTLALMP